MAICYVALGLQSSRTCFSQYLISCTGMWVSHIMHVQHVRVDVQMYMYIHDIVQDGQTLSSMYVHRVCIVHVAGKGILTEYSLSLTLFNIFPTPFSHTLTPVHPSSSTQTDFMKQCHKYLHIFTDSHHNQVHTYMFSSI